MDIASVEFGMAHVIKSPGHASKERICDKVLEADKIGLVRKIPMTSSMFIRQGFPIHFEAFIDNRLCMVRGIISREYQITESDSGYVRDNHVWIIFSSKMARHVSIDINPLPGRDYIWIRPIFKWDNVFELQIKENIIQESTGKIMDSLAYNIHLISEEDYLDYCSVEASRLRCLFIDSIIKGAKEPPKNIKLPLSKSTFWRRSSVLKCWSQAMHLVHPCSNDR
jgi:hypothetical protein